LDVLWTALVATLAAAWVGTGLDLRTSRRELVPDGDVNQARWDAVRADFADPEPLIVVIERNSAAVSIASIKRAAERVAARLETDTRVSSVFYRVDIDWISDHALHLATPADLLAAVSELEGVLADEGGEIQLHNFADLNVRLAERIEASLAAGAVLPAGAETEARRLSDFVAAERDFLAAPQEWAAGLAASPVGLLDAEVRGSITANGFLSTDDGDVLFVLVHPAGDSHGGLERFQSIAELAREVASEVTAEAPGLHFGLTGPPAMEVEEMASAVSATPAPNWRSFPYPSFLNTRRNLVWSRSPSWSVSMVRAPKRGASWPARVRSAMRRNSPAGPYWESRRTPRRSSAATFLEPGARYRPT